MNKECKIARNVIVLAFIALTMMIVILESI